MAQLIWTSRLHSAAVALASDASQTLDARSRAAEMTGERVRSPLDPAKVSSVSMLRQRLNASPAATEFEAAWSELFAAMRWLDLWEEGEAWARSLKAGDEFRGSHGEAAHRGYTADADRRAFGGGALEVIKGARIWTDRGCMVIARIEWGA